MDVRTGISMEGVTPEVAAQLRADLDEYVTKILGALDAGALCSVVIGMMMDEPPDADGNVKQRIHGVFHGTHGDIAAVLEDNSEHFAQMTLRLALKCMDMEGGEQ